MNLGVGEVIGECLRTGRAEDFVTATPYRQQRHLAGAKVFLHARVHRRVGGVILQQLQLHVVVARPRYQCVVVIPGSGIYQGLVGYAGEVLPPGGVQREELSYCGFVVGRLLILIGPHDFPEAFDEAGVVPVAALADDRRDRGRVMKRQPPANGCAVILYIDRVPADAKRAQQALGQLGQRIECVVELLDGRCVGKPEAEMVRCNHVVAVGECRNQIPEHVRAGRKSVQEHHRGCVGIARFTKEQPMTIDGGVAVMNSRHEIPPARCDSWAATECDFWDSHPIMHQNLRVAIASAES